jgi:hypothetical protein
VPAVAGTDGHALVPLARCADQRPPPECLPVHREAGLPCQYKVRVRAMSVSLHFVGPCYTVRSMACMVDNKWSPLAIEGTLDNTYTQLTGYDLICNNIRCHGRCTPHFIWTLPSHHLSGLLAEQALLVTPPNLRCSLIRHFNKVRPMRT